MNKPNDQLLITQNLQELNVIMNICNNIISTMDLEELLQIICDGMGELIGIESASIYLLKENDNIFLGAALPALDSNISYELREFSVYDHPHIQRSIESKQSIYIFDINAVELSEKERFVVDLLSLRTLFYLPFIQKEKVLGILILGTSNQSILHSEHQIYLAQTVANQLSVSIYNAILHDDLLKYKEHLEELVQEKTKDLDAAIEELRAANEDLYEKNDIINEQNVELRATLHHLKDAQQHLIEAEKMASLGVLTAGVAHEINNPLNFLSGSCIGLENYFNDNLSVKTPDVDLYLESLKTGVERISAIVNGLNQFSRTNTALNENCNIHSILDNCLAVLNNQFKSKASVIKNYFSEEIIITGNIGKLHQVFMNLLLNSLHAVGSDGKIEIVTSRSEKAVCSVEIYDNGSGINAEILDKITDPFFTTKEPGRGTGLGLSISYSIVKEHKGCLEFESEEGVGTKAKVILPGCQNIKGYE